MRNSCSINAVLFVLSFACVLVYVKILNGGVAIWDKIEKLENELQTAKNKIENMIQQQHQVCVSFCEYLHLFVYKVCKFLFCLYTGCCTYEQIGIFHTADPLSSRP